MTILEFNEETQGFHLNTIVDNVPQNALNTFGWYKVLVSDTDLEALFFSDFIQIEYLNKGVKLTTQNVSDTISNLSRFLRAINDLKTTINNN
jgi:hypothetical protein